MLKEDVKILGVMNGDPFDYRTWSGSSYYFFNALERNKYLYRAISARPSEFETYLFKISSFHPSIDKWKFKFDLNIGYYDRMTGVALNKLDSIPGDCYNVILQVGAWYDLTKVREKERDKLILSYHDGNIQTLLNSPYGYPAIRPDYIRKVIEREKGLYGKHNRIFTMSKWLAGSFIRDFGVNPDKVVPVGAGINLPYVKEVRDKSYDEHKILFVGKAFERKGGRYLIEAFKEVKKEVKDAALVIVGPKLEGLPDGVTCLDSISKSTPEGIERLLNEYASASLFAMPSLYEPFGIVFLEAMAHRLPCIGTNVCAMPEIIEHGINGFLVPPREVKALADRIIELLKNPKTCREMGDNAFRKYNREFTWDKVTNRIIECIP